MKTRLYNYICIFVLLEIIQPPYICHAKVINDAYSFRTKRNISVFKIPQPKENANYAKDLQEVNSKIEKKDNNNFEKGDMYFKEKHKISKRSTNFDFQQLNPEKSINYDNVIAISHLNTQRSNDESDYAGEADEEMMKQERDKDEETSNLVRLARDVNAGLDKYTDQERSSLYDDYEAKDVAKRGVLGSPEDYEEAEVDSPGIEDVAAMQEQRSAINKLDKREMQNDARVKRDQAIAETPDKSILDNPARSVQSRITPEDSYLHEISPAESLKSFNEASASNDASKIKEFGSNEAISKASGASKIAEPASIITSSKEDEANAKYEKRVEEEIQRKIDSIKGEIQRDIEAQGRVRGIEKNNARFDELQNQEDEDEEGSSLENESVEKRQTVAKRSVREVADIAAAKKNGKKQSLKKQQRKKQQRKKLQRTRTKKIGKSDISKKNKNLKRRSVINHNESSKQTPSKGLFKKKREHVRQTFPVSNEQAKKRRSTNYALSSNPTGARSENELLDQDSNSHLYTDNKMLQAPLSVASEDENNEGEQSPAAAAHSNSLASLIGSSQELNPRLAKEYKEAFGGLQSEPGSALARFKRIKRVLQSPETEKI